MATSSIHRRCFASLAATRAFATPPFQSPAGPPPLPSSSAPAGGAADPISYCRELVRAQDHEHFLVSHFYPEGRARDSFWALRALNIELASVQETVTNPTFGRMKFQFWRDALASITNGLPPPKHPVALALAQTSTPSTADLTAYYLNQLIDAREEHLNDPPPPTLVSLLTTLQRTSTSLHLLSLSLLTPTPTDQAQTSLQHLSLSTGLATLLRGTPHHLGAHRKLPGVPLDLLASAGVRMEGLLRGEEEDRAKLRDAVWEVAVRANDEMLTARMEWKDTGGKVPREIMPAFLGAIPTTSYLNRLAKTGADVLDPTLATRHWRLPIDIWWANWRRSF